MTSIFVAKLDYGVNQEDLKSAFEAYGKVNKVTIAMDKETGRSKGFAFIEMFNQEEALTAIRELDGSSMNGRQIAVKIAEDRSNSRPQQNSGYGNQARPSANHTPQDRKPADAGDAPRRAFGDDAVPEFRPDVLPLANPFKGEPRKKDLKKKEKPKDVSDGRARQHKMEAYKKSGKSNRFLGFDEDDDF